MQPGPILLIHAVPALLAVALAVRAWRRRDVRGNSYMALLMAAVCLWAVTEAMVHMVPDSRHMQFWSVVSYLGSQTTPVFFFLFVLSFTWLEARVGRLWRYALFIVPMLSIALAATNHLHGLVWSSITPTETAYGTTGVFGHGPWFFFQIAYSYLLILMAIVMLARAAVRLNHLYSMQTRLLLLGSLAPFAGNIVYVAGFSPVPGLDITPAAFSVTGLILSLAVSRFRFLSSGPVSRDSLLSIMKDGIIALSSDLSIVEINPAAMRILGLEGKAPIGETAGGALGNHPELLAAITPGVVSATLVRLGDRHVELDINPLPARPGAPPGRMLVLRDVTSRRRAEEALRASEERFRDLVDLLPIGIYESDSEARITYVNRAAMDMFGFSSKNILPGDFRTVDILSPAAREKWPLIRRMLATRGIALNLELEAMRADGTTFPVIVNACSIDPDDFLRGTRGVIIDITERKSAETALTEREKRLSAIFDNAGAGMDLVNADGRFLKVNKALADMLGYTVDELEGMYVTEVTHPDDMRASGEKLRALQSGEVDAYQMDKRYIRRDGTIIWISLSVTPIRNTDGGTEAIIGLISDITDRVAVEDALRAAKEAAEEASRVKSEFLANMSHEIRTPLNGIIGLAHLALKTGLTDRQRDYLDKIGASAKMLSGIINDLLDFSKIEAGRIELEEVDFSLDDILKNLLAVLGRPAEEKGLEIFLHITAGMPLALRGDPLRLQQVLFNLLSNAVKFTHHGEVVLRVEAPVRPGDGADRRISVRFTVRDTGIGIPVEDQAKIFQSFTQADTAITRRYGGTGLGLSISKRLVELMGGEIGFTSVPGSGSRFYFTVPLEMRKPGEPALRRTAEFGKLRLLVVDDSDTSLEILDESLTFFGFTVTTARSGAEALSLIEGNPPGFFDLALIDWKMPDLDGIETAARIRALSKKMRVPEIIIVSAYDPDIVRERSGKVGVRRVLPKPVTPSVLLESVMEALGISGRSPERVRGDKLAVAAKARYTGKAVLLVEDDPISRQVVRELLKPEGIDVVEAVDGARAIELLEQGLFDLVFMDVQMPVMDGLEATTRIRADARYRDLPIVAMTAYAMRGDRDRCLEVGMNDHLPKPVDPDALFAALSRWLGPGTAAENAAGVKETHPAEAGAALSGIDMEFALHRMRGDEGFLRQLVAQFCDLYANAPAVIGKHLEAGETYDARRLAHSINGSAGTLGALRLQKSAAALEKVIADGGADIAAPLSDFGRELGVVLANRAPSLKDDEIKHAAPSTGPAEALGLLARLQRETAAGSYGALDTFAALKRAWPGRAPKDLAELDNALARFDNESAISLIARLEKKLNGGRS
ncbi:MAG TPA: histidine kinase N-terminal 7TM domain-containing protein [Spirochaetota bacterium]|nr:histidine kinase N-terminal 7TM domain-containing protein [Spirochaetota bacterium]